MLKSWGIFILCFGCGDPPQRQQFDSLRSCQEAIATGQFIAGPGVAVVAFCGLERIA